MIHKNYRDTLCLSKLIVHVAGLRQGPGESQKVDWVETRLGRSFYVCPTGTGNLPINEHRSHYKDDRLFRRINCGEGVGAQEAMRRSRVHWFVVVGSESNLW